LPTTASKVTPHTPPDRFGELKWDSTDTRKIKSAASRSAKRKSGKHRKKKTRAELKRRELRGFSAGKWAIVLPGAHSVSGGIPGLGKKK
jgi:hypothetical protein